MKNFHRAMRVESILIFSFSHIGDAVLSTCVIPPLQRHFPDARISVLVGPKSCNILWGDVRISELIIYDNRGAHAGLSGKRRLIRELKTRKFDLIVDLRDSFWSRFIDGTRWGMPSSRRYTASYRESHAVDRYLGILSAHGVESEGAAPEIRLLKSEERSAAAFLSRNGVLERNMIIGIHPGGGWSYKLWPVERFAALGEFLSQRYGAKILVFSGPDEAPLQEQMAYLMKSTPILVKDVGLRELSALIQRCNIYIGNDTGPMHIAAAVGTRVIAIFGPTSAVRSGPYGSQHIVIAESIECSPCHPGRRPGGCNLDTCMAMEAVSVSRVAEAVGRNLSNERESHTSC